MAGFPLRNISNNTKQSIPQPTVLMLVFLLIITPLGPVFANEESQNLTPPVTEEFVAELQSRSGGEVNESEKISFEVGESTESKPIYEESSTLSATSATSESDPYTHYIDKHSKAKIHVDDNTGALVQDISIAVPAGRNGLAPELRLTYNSQSHDNSNIFGYGWSVSLPFIERSNKTGTDKLYTEKYFNSSLSGELVQSGPGDYISKIENGSFIKYTFRDNSWLAKDKKGITYKFGMTTASRQDNPFDAGQIYKWLLEEVRDTNGNFVRYEYHKDSGQIYPSKIVYTGNGFIDGIYLVEFVKETRPDYLTSYATAFKVVTNFRIKEIIVTANGDWVKKYLIRYIPGDNGVRSLLGGLTIQGKDEAGAVSQLPEMKFDYQKSTISWTYSESTWVAPTYLSDYKRSLVDLNGDGMEDIMESFQEWESWPVQKNVYIFGGNNKWSASPTAVMEPPVLFNKRETRGGAYSQVWDQGARSADLNGDLYSDILVGLDVPEDSTVPGVYTSFLNNSGKGWAENKSWTPAFGFTKGVGSNPTGGGGSISEYGARVLDLNGDGLPDITRQSEFKGTQLNLGTGFGALNSNWNPPVAGYNEPRHQLTDLNGDGLPDIVSAVWLDYCVAQNKKTYLNTGIGAWQVYDELQPPMVHIWCSAPTDMGVRYVDINGDKLVDAVVDPADQTGGNRYTYLNLGNGWSPRPDIFLPIPNNGLKEGETKSSDFSGDGLVDFIYTASNPSCPHQVCVKTWVHNGLIPDLLSKITYPSGGSASISYLKSTAYFDETGKMLNPEAHVALDTVRRIDSNDGSGNISSYSYTYQGGKYYYRSALDRRFAGYNKLTVVDANGNKVVTFFHQGDSSVTLEGEYNDHASKIGKPYKIEKLDKSGNIYTKIINKWDHVALGGEANFVKKIQTIQMDYDGNTTHKDRATTFTFSNTSGNLTQQIEWGEVNASDNGTFTDVGSDKFITNISYATGSTLGVTGLPSDETTLNQSNAKVKQIRHYYDSLLLGSVEKGNETKTEDWRKGTNYINTQRTYNAYGLVTQELDERGNATNYTYDSFNLYPITVAKPHNLVTQYVYNYSLGKPKQVTTPNNFVFQTVYDGLDRVIAEKQPDITTPANLVTKTSYTYTNLPVGEVIQKTDHLDASTSVDTFMYTDGLGRVIQTRTEAEDVNTFAVSDVVYNSSGLVEKESLPYFSTGSAKTSPTANNSLYSIYTYDPLERVTSLVNAVGATLTAYDDWKTTVTDANNKPKSLYKDAYGNLVKVEEFNAGNTYTTTYTYNYLGNLTKITDPLGNIRNFTYDGLGRRLTAEDLHAVGDTTFGKWTYTYDATSNLTRIVDPNGNTINYTYDKINRKQTENWNAVKGVEVRYTYDSCPGGKTLLCSVSKPETISESREYNALGLVKKETRTIDSVNYVTQYTYDYQGNQTLVTYPDNSQVQYVYNSAGLLEQVKRKEASDASFANLIMDYDYNPLGKVTFQSHSNGVNTTNTYDAAKLYRMSNKTTVLPDASKAQNLTYTYDNVGNITRIVDASNTNSAKTVNYTYDDLHRLTSATATGAANGQNYTQNYTYNAIGNILTKSDVSGAYAYTGNTGTNYANPHAVTAIGSVNYTYDRNGNLTNISDGTAYTYDYNNRMTQAVSGGNTITYSYDYDGSRLKYATATGTTVYPNRLYNIKESKRTKHVFANGLVVATIETDGAATTVHQDHTDHLTGSNVITDSAGAKAQLLDYYPFGSIRLDEKTGTFDEQRKYAGHEFDSDTGLSYMQSRYYTGDMARFLSQDKAFSLIGGQEFSERYNRPLELHLTDPQSLNSYSYVNNNPLKYTDESGEILPYLVAAAGVAWVALEWGSAGYDVGIAVNTWRDSKASVGQKLENTGWAAFGIASIGPGQGYKQAVNRFGITKVLDAYRISNKYNFGKGWELLRHFSDHAADVGAKNPEEYARKAQDFYKNSIGKPGVLNKLDKDGTIRIYDPSTNTFGAYNQTDNSTRTFYKPDPSEHGKATNMEYWNQQRGDPIW